MAKKDDGRRARRFLEAHTGDESQFAGVRRFRIEEGRAAGSSFAEVATGSGFVFTVALDRALDISRASFNGKSLCWRSPGGDASPGLYDPEGLGWLKTFFGGLVTTCGLTHTGAPMDFKGKHYGLHGPIANTPAEEVACRSRWEGNDLVNSVSGKVRQAVLFGEKLMLHRRIETRAFAKSLSINDTVENTGHERAPLMIMYHVNAGWPVLEDGSRLLLNADVVEPFDDHAKDGIEKYDRFHAPTRGYREKCYLITPRPDRRGDNFAAVVNRARDFGLYLKWQAAELPHLVEWKMMGYRDYVVGVEPCTVHDLPRDELIRRKMMPYLGPGKSRELHLEIGVLDGRGEVREAARRAGVNL